MRSYNARCGSRTKKAKNTWSRSRRRSATCPRTSAARSATRPSSPIVRGRDHRREQTVAVRFEAEHEFDGTPRAVALILVDPEFHTHLELPDLNLPEVEAQETSGSEH